MCIRDRAYCAYALKHEFDQIDTIDILDCNGGCLLYTSDQRLGISLGMRREQVAKAIKEHPNAVAVLVNNPTYYGICSDLRAIVRMAHEAGMLCLADEAHGLHLPDTAFLLHEPSAQLHEDHCKFHNR